jgi:hypothetical protein
MTTHPMNPGRSEKGVALIIVLLLLAVMAGLTTGLTLNGQTEIAMAHNETYYAGARAAAEAGMNRAVQQIINDTELDLMVTKAVPDIGNGPIALNDEYSYSFQLLDDDDPALYNGVALTPAQLTAMGAGSDPPTPEDGDPDTDTNSRMILRCTATGPRGTTVTVARVLSRFTTLDAPTVTTINPAILVNGNLSLDGNSLVVNGLQGNVHANGNITGGPATGITGNVTATGSIDESIDPGGMKASGTSTIPVPSIKASDYIELANYKLTSVGGVGVIQVKIAGVWSPCVSGSKTADLACPTGWSYGSGVWSASGSMPVSPLPGNKATYYVEGSAEIHGTGKSTGFTAISVITEGSLKITGNGKFKSGNDSKIQFVANGDLELGGTADADDPIDMDGQIMVGEQIKIYGNSEFQGRVMAENRDSTANSCAVANVPGCRKGNSTLAENNLSGNMTVTYNGQLGGITVPDPPGPPTYTNIISGWMEQQ